MWIPVFLTIEMGCITFVISSAKIGIFTEITKCYVEKVYVLGRKIQK